MSVVWRLAWRNLWRHRRRTWLTVGAMVFCNVLLIFLIALQLGSYDMMIRNSLGPITGHAQVQHPDYLEDGKMRQTVPAAESLAEAIRAVPGLESAAVRAMGFALASSEDRSYGIQITGVQPAFEPLVSTLPGMVSEGRYLNPGSTDEIVVGSVLARNLRIVPGDELVFIGSARDGSTAAAAATVVGIVETGFEDADRAMAQVHLDWFQEVFAMGDTAHSIVLRVPRLEDLASVLPDVRAVMPGDGSSVLLDWEQLEPGLRQAITSDMASAWFMYLVLVFLVAFSVLNTQLMSVMERTREFGVMLSLGMRPGMLARLVGMETLLLSLLGLGIGVLGGAILTAYLAVAGFTFPGMDEMAAQFNLPEKMYPQLSALALLWGPGTVFAGTMLAAIYPASRLFKLQPVAAMRAV